ncbi:hypothetical protein J6TS2_50480 [Heyndrickxia sporothermodurans]|nr:hypothetical protein J6TS2_50480 [Heyndrickxia sporothermodurans]
MNTDQKLEVLKAALELGADIHINFHLDDQQRANTIIKTLSTMTGQEVNYRVVSGDTHCYKMGNHTFDTSIFCKEKEEVKYA